VAGRERASPPASSSHRPATPSRRLQSPARQPAEIPPGRARSGFRGCPRVARLKCERRDRLQKTSQIHGTSATIARWISDPRTSCLGAFRGSRWRSSADRGTPRAGDSRKRIVLGWLRRGFSWQASAERAPVTEAVSSPWVLPAGWCSSLRTSGVRRFLRHFRASFAVFSEETAIQTVPTRGALYARSRTGSPRAAYGIAIPDRVRACSHC